MEELSVEIDLMIYVLSKSSHSAEEFQESFIYGVVDQLAPEQWREEEVIIALTKMALDKELPALLENVMHHAQDLSEFLDMASKEKELRFLARVISMTETQQYAKWGEAMIHAAKGGLDSAPQGRPSTSRSTDRGKPPGKMIGFLPLLDAFFHHPTLPSNIPTKHMVGIIEELLKNSCPSTRLFISGLFSNRVLEDHFTKFSMSDWDRILKAAEGTPFVATIHAHSQKYVHSAIRNTQEATRKAEEWVKVGKVHAPPSFKSYFEAVVKALMLEASQMH